VTPAAEPPPAVASTPAETPADPVVVVSRDTRNEVLVSKDTPLAFYKAGRTESALLRQAIFLTGALTVVRPAAGTGGETLRWTYQPYLQRQLCFTSITGQFSCAAAELEQLAEKAEGEAPLAPAPAPVPGAEDAHAALATALRARADGLFEDDQRLELGPMLKAAGVSVLRTPVSTGSGRR
jgi:hypothetical protein